MTEIESLFGTHAGVVWYVLSQKGPLSKQELLTHTNLTEQQLNIAIGWLARENKIRKEQQTYLLGETNLLPSIGTSAGKIWKALDIWGEVDILSLSRLSRVEIQDAFTAVGWLAKEGKINGVMEAINEAEILFWLK